MSGANTYELGLALGLITIVVIRNAPNYGLLTYLLSIDVVVYELTNLSV